MNIFSRIEKKVQESGWMTATCIIFGLILGYNLGSTQWKGLIGKYTPPEPQPVVQVPAPITPHSQREPFSLEQEGIKVTGDLDGSIEVKPPNKQKFILKAGQRYAEGHQGKITTLAVGIGGRYLASGDENGMIYIWDLEKQKILDSADKGNGLPVQAVTFTIDSQWVVALVTHQGQPAIRILFGPSYKHESRFLNWRTRPRKRINSASGRTRYLPRRERN